MPSSNFGSAQPLEGTVQATLSSQIRAHIDRLSTGASDSTFEEAARRFNALPLYQGWEAWALLTEQGDVLEGTDEGELSAVAEPMRTMYLVAGAERYPELKVLLPERPLQAQTCVHCNGTGWIPIGDGKFRCGECRALGWVVGPSNTSLERTRER